HISSLPLHSPPPQIQPRSICPANGILETYWPSWKSQAPTQIPWSDTNFAVYFVAGTASDPTSLHMPDGRSEEFVRAARDAGKKSLLSIGGWLGSYWFSELVRTSDSRSTFATTIYNTLLEFGFDGVDIDWEFPGSAGNGNPFNSADTDNFLAFLAVLRAILGEKLITLAIPGTVWIGSDGSPLTNTAQFAAYVDYATLMAYDQWAGPFFAQENFLLLNLSANLLLQGPYFYTTGPGSPIASCNPVHAGETSVPNLLSYWVNSGFPACQILLVTELRLILRPISRLQAHFRQVTITGRAPLPISQQLGRRSPRILIICLQSSSVSAAERLLQIKDWDSCTSTPFLFNPQSRTFITYEDAESTGIKAQFAELQGLAGITLFDSAGLTSNVLVAVEQGLRGDRSDSGFNFSHHNVESSDTGANWWDGYTTVDRSNADANHNPN
ncbi:chitinase, partial [Phenoliferia sp. Uapishka_3]